jgi:hypothetical protein
MTSTDHSSALVPDSQIARLHIQHAAVIVGGAFILVGILGFVPGVTTHYHGTGGMGFSGRNSSAELLGVFRVSVLHNGLHLLLGGAGLIASFKPLWARLYLLLGGVVYLVLFVYGLLIDFDSDANFVPLNSADNWLHLGLALAMIAVGLVVGRRRRDA